jgi:carbamoyltransferase
LSGGLDLVHENPYDIPKVFTHDGAVVLVEDGEVVAAIEEERLNRIKHSNKFPVRGLQFCLNARGARLEDIDRIAFYATEDYCNALLARLHLTRSEMSTLPNARSLVRERIERELGVAVDPEKLVFVRHHLAHAVSAHAMSGFERSLVLAIDGYGDFLSGLVGIGDRTGLQELATFPQRESLGVFYLEVIQFLGYGSFDEYKVMGLAPYGDPTTYRDTLARCYALDTDGRYAVHHERIAPALLGRIEVRKKGQPFSQQHKDLAAALQEALERLALHVIRHHATLTGERRLSLSGGVAHNCTMNGKILTSGLFDDVFVQPASHDAGCALGAALVASAELGRPAPVRRLAHVYWGTDVGSDTAIAAELEPWRDFLAFERSPDVARQAAKLMAEGAVIGWVQGRSEFGPRALGNRSILADPRPADNKSRINAMVKKREGYRPFAPTVLEEDLHGIFEVPPEVTALPFMIFVVSVREHYRAALGAITHVDGTARVQTVSRAQNPRYWDVIHAFKELTGVPLLLNTSFNNDVEPIVDSIEDAVVSFLTTGLDYLVIGDCLARKRVPTWSAKRALTVSLPAYARVQLIRSFTDAQHSAVSAEFRVSHDAGYRYPLSPALAAPLLALDHEQSVGALLDDRGVSTPAQPALVTELEELWSRRLVRLRPR